jgi:two-component system LytT family response regulator
MHQVIKAVIVEDEPLARELLRNYLNDHQWIELAGEYADGFTAIQAINGNRPDLVFLDIKIPKITGLELMELLEYQPYIVFTTAYDAHAIKAFELNALDYLLKPFSRERFSMAIEKVKKRIDSASDPVGKSTSFMLKPGEIIRRIVVKSGARIHIISTLDIVYLEAQDDFVMIHTSGKRYLKQQTMKFYEAHLDPLEFIRTHRSYMVAIDKIVRLEPYEKESYRLFLETGNHIPVSKSGYKKLKSVLKF